MRKRQAVKRDVLPDPIYKSKVVTKLINQIMKDGKKGTAQKILYGAFDMVKEKTGEDAMVVFDRAMNNIKPALCQEVHKEMGPFLNEYMYQDALAIELGLREMPYEKEFQFPADYKGYAITHKHFADFKVQSGAAEVGRMVAF